MWVLDRPIYLLFLAVLPVLIYMRNFSPIRGGRIHLSFSLYGGERFHSPPNTQRLLLGFSTLLYWLAWILIIIALAGPSRTTRERIYLSRGIDIVLVLDESASMAAADFRPDNRFETARSVMLRFIEERPSDHIGLVGFSAEAAMRVPPTLDHSYLKESLNSMKLMELGDGTAIGMGIALSALHLQAGGAQERVIVLLTDGVNNAGEISPESAARAAADAGIKIYAIGVGSSREALIEVRDPTTGQLYRGTVKDSYDEESLKRIAELSGGQYFTAGSAGTLQAVFETIGTAQSVERRFRVQIHRNPFHRQFIFLGLVFLLVDFFIRRILVRVVP